jgi:predicted amidohydrolase
MRVGVVQLNSKILDVEGNTERTLQLIGRKHADLWVLPELFNTGYNFRTRKELAGVAEQVPHGETTDALLDLSRKDGGMVVAGLAERKGQTYYNTAVVVKDGKYLGAFRKVHLFCNEKKFFKPGHEFKVFGRVGVMVCFDWIFPESARTLMMKGADIIAHPSNLVLPHCPDAMKVRAIENHVFTVTADRVGVERGLRFIGQSEIIDPNGEVLYRASGSKEECVARSIDPGKAQDKSVTPLNNLVKDRMLRAYKS